MNKIIKITFILLAIGFILNACSEDPVSNPKTGPYEELLGVYKYSLAGYCIFVMDDGWSGHLSSTPKKAPLIF